MWAGATPLARLLPYGPAMGAGRVRVAIVGFLTLGVVVAGCSSSDDDSATSDTAAGGASPTTAAAADLDAGAARADLPAAVQTPGVRLVARVGSLTVETDDVDAASREAGAIATAAGGVVFAQDSNLGETAHSVVTLKVPPDQLDAVLERLGSLGDVKARTIGTEDVTDQAYDLDGRIESAETSVDRLREFLAGATSVQDVAALEAELTRRETELEVLLGQRRSLQSRVDEATVILTLREPDRLDAVESIPGVGSALATGLKAFWLVTRVVLVGLAFVLPFALAGGAFAWLALRIVRWRTGRRRPLAPPPPAPAAGG